MVEVPGAFVDITAQREGLAGHRWVEALPVVVDRLLYRWRCHLTGPARHGRVALVVPVSCPAGSAMPKVSFPHPSNRGEPDALRQFAGRGAIRLFDADESLFALLLERAGERALSAEPSPEAAIEIAGALARRLAVPAAPGDPLPALPAGSSRDLVPPAGLPLARARRSATVVTARPSTHRARAAWRSRRGVDPIAVDPADDVPMTVRAATADDLDAIVDLAATAREGYAAHEPTFWRVATDARAAHRRFLAGQIADDSVVSLVSIDQHAVVGFAVGVLHPAPPVYDPGGPTCTVDDFTVEDPARWTTTGADLLHAVRSRAAALGAVQIVVVVGAHDRAKQAALTVAGLSATSHWWTAPIAGVA